jgi:hypothetical protein
LEAKAVGFAIPAIQSRIMREFDLMTKNNVSRQDHMGISQEKVDAENDVENQDTIYFSGIEIERWKPFCYLSRKPERIDCYNCEMNGRKTCAPRWRK